MLSRSWDDNQNIDTPAHTCMYTGTLVLVEMIVGALLDPAEQIHTI